jgi:SSS family solute:Na+ symporter
MAKLASLVVKFGALAFIIFLPQAYAINLQLLGGVWIIQTFPSVVLGLYTRWLDAWALLIGWASGVAVGSWMFWAYGNSFPLQIGGLTVPGYPALYALVLNLAVTIVLTLLFKALGASHATDGTSAIDYV